MLHAQKAQKSTKKQQKHKKHKKTQKRNQAQVQNPTSEKKQKMHLKNI